MENLSDIEEIIPPTPDIQHKSSSRAGKSIQASKLSRKHSKLDTNYKRKRIISPDYKKVKQKVKQVTLYNFLIKENKSTSNSNALCNAHSSVKTNLLNKFEESDAINKNIDIIPASSTLDFVKEPSYLETKIPLDSVGEEIEMCNEVSSLQLNSQNNNNEVHISLHDKNLSSCPIEAENDSNKLNKINVEDNFRDAEHSFSWMTDVDWDIEKENFGSSCNSPDHNVLLKDYICHSETEEDCCMKFKVKDIQKDLSKNEIKLSVVACNNSAVTRTVFLRGFWTDSIVDVGDTVNILKPSNTIEPIIDNDTGFIVTNPDFLISSTAVVSTLFCMRKAVLNHILPQWSPGNNIMMIGSLIHDIFQKSVNSHTYTPEGVLKIIKHVMKKRENLIALCCQDMGEGAIEEKICKYVPNIVQWINKHCNFDGKSSIGDISITNVEDIEENVWCPKYGVKGKIDMTVNVQCPSQVNSKLMPLELKTGRPSFSAEHIGQVNLYSLMMEERSKEISDGLLLYLRDKAEMKVITTNHNSKRGLIQLRNELASYVYKWVSSNVTVYEEIEQCHLPKPINNKRLCEKCPYLLPCTVYQKAFKKENNLDADHAMNTLMPSSTDHLSTSHMEYFYHWSRLLLLENTTTAEVKAFWTEDAIKRERKGLCLSYVLLNENVKARQDINSEYYIHTFTRAADNPVSPDFKDSCLKEGDYVAISNQNNFDEVAVSMGYIVKICEQYFELATERNLGNLTRLKGCIFRIDKLVSNSAAACVRNNLMLLMQQENQAEKIRKLVIDKETPNFLQALPKQIALLGRPILKSLNKNQQKAVLKALMAKDYFLIKGMPGTGKTSTIVALVRLLVQMNVSVLLTSYTHSAIDNILLKLKEYTEFVRIGPKYRIHPDILKFSFENLTQDFSSVVDFTKFMKEKMVVATTCLGINHAIFKLRKFDICIVDEASQINQIASLGPLFFAKKFILVGDEKQLPPLVLNSEARKKGMQESLFQRLQSPLNCIELTVQYRMNQEIMRICNELTYDGALQCGSDDVACAVLQLHQKEEIREKTYPSWLLSAVSTDLVKSVMFLSTDKYQTGQSGRGKSDIEADLVILLLQFFLQSGVSQSVIGVIAPYRKQVDLIEMRLKNLKLIEIEVNTVDQYQGRDKDIIIISCVRPNDTLPKEEKTGVILDDEKRLNVAISRAKKKLLLIGSKTLLHSYKPFKDLIMCLRNDQFIDIT